MKKLTIGIDFDDVLVKCTEWALELEALKGNRLDYESVDKWGKTGRPTDVIFKYFGEASFYESQPLYDGAQDFVAELQRRGHNIVIITAVDGRFSNIRVGQIQKYFPNIGERNIVLTSRKDLVHVDVLIDDAPHNIEDTPAQYPILMRRPWNQHLSGLISVYSYQEILAFIDRISMTPSGNSKKQKIICLVGPSGSGKIELAEELIKDRRFAIPRSMTTRAPKSTDSDAYDFVSREEFDKLFKEQCFIESTVYAGNRYGTTQEQIDNILNRGQNVVFPIDFAGANMLKMKYAENCLLVYLKRPKETIVSALLDRLQSQMIRHPDMTDSIKQEIRTRILSIDAEKKNAEFCDKVINNGSIAEAVKQIEDLL